MTILDIVYWSCFALGTAYTLVTVLAGGMGHAVSHIGHVHVPHIGNGAGHAVSGHGATAHAHAPIAHGHGDAGHSGHNVDQAHHAELNDVGSKLNLLQYLNPLSVASFLLGFGGVGVVVRMIGFHQKASILCALAAGWGLWLVSWWIVTRVFGAAEGTSHNTWDDVIGLRAQVTVPIEGLKSGTVAYVVGGTRQTAKAISEDDELIPTGATVRIKRIENHTATVSRVD